MEELLKAEKYEEVAAYCEDQEFKVRNKGSAHHSSLDSWPCYGQATNVVCIN